MYIVWSFSVKKVFLHILRLTLLINKELLFIQVFLVTNTEDRPLGIP